MNLLVLLNPHARGGRSKRLAPKVAALLAQTSHVVMIVQPGSVDNMRARIRAARGNGFEAVIVAGGDGTLHDALGVIEESGLPLGLIPLGRGNDFARNVGIPQALEASCAFPDVPEIREVDLPTVNGFPFGSIACVGFDAVVNQLSREHKGYLKGTAGYVVCVLKALLSFTPFDVELTLDSRRWHGSISMIAVANGQCYGGGMKMAPHAVMDDGLLTAVIVRALTPMQLLRKFPRVFTGTHVHDARIDVVHARCITIATDGPRDVWADGEHCGALPATFLVGHTRVRVLMPRAAVSS
jgi:diacylglycerol kinase (ATP)